MGKNERERPTLEGPLLKALFQNGESSLLVGRLYARKFEEALIKLQDGGEIIGFRLTEINSEDDAAGIDCWVEIEENRLTPFQITSTQVQAKIRKKKHPEIPVVYVRTRKGLRIKPRARLMAEIMKGICQYQFEDVLRELEGEGKILGWLSEERRTGKKYQGDYFLIIPTTREIPLGITLTRGVSAKTGQYSNIPVIPVRTGLGWRPLGKLRGAIMAEIGQST